MSFSSECKQELCRLPLTEKSCCRLAELSALYMAAGSLNLLGRGQTSVQFTVESAAIAKRVFLLLQKEMEVSAQVHSVTNARFGGMKRWTLTLGPTLSPIFLTRLSLMDLDHHGHPVLCGTSPKVPLNRLCCIRAFLRGAMLGAGTVTHPDRGYRLEVQAPDEAFRLMIAKCMQRFDLPVHQSRRKETELIYLTQADQVSTFLTVIGANQAVLSLEDSRVRRQVMGGVNRAMNCDAANLQKQMNASDQQMEEIGKLLSSERFQTMPLSLQEIALARIHAPDASLTELGQMLSPPLGKSGVNHRMRRLMDYARGLSSTNQPQQSKKETIE